MDRHRSAERLAAAANRLSDLGLDALVVAPSPDLAYLLGYAPMPLERPTLLLIVPDGTPTLIVPMLERSLAMHSPGPDGLEVIAWGDGEDPYRITAGALPAEGRVALGDRIWGVHLLGLQTAAPALTWTSAAPVVGALRARKDAAELDALRRAGAAADATFAAIATLPFTGRREREIAEDLARLLVEHGHERAEFTIVASGPNAASPHHEPGERTIAAGEVVVLDFGGLLDGYFSDTTRTVSAGGAPSDQVVKVHDVVRRAHEAAVAAVRPGVEIQEVDRAARAVIRDAGFADAFIHRTGHGIGLEVHEPPYAVEGDRTVLEPGMTFSVEPGIYLEGRFGVRIEDIVVVTHDGVEQLNRSTRALTRVR